LISLVEYIKNLSSNYRVQQTLNTNTLLPEQPDKAPAKGAGAQGVSKP